MIRVVVAFFVTFVVVTAASAAWHIYTIPERAFDRLEGRYYAAGFENGEWNHWRQLMDHTFTTVTRPNNDTLYSSAFIDLSRGPMMLTVPETGERYYSIQFMDPMTNVYEVISRRTRGGTGGTYAVLPPGYGGYVPQADGVVRAPADRAWVLVRILIDGEADLPAVHALQDQLRLEPAGD